MNFERIAFEGSCGYVVVHHQAVDWKEDILRHECYVLKFVLLCCSLAGGIGTSITMAPVNFFVVAAILGLAMVAQPSLQQAYGGTGVPSAGDHSVSMSSSCSMTVYCVSLWVHIPYQNDLFAGTAGSCAITAKSF